MERDCVHVTHRITRAPESSGDESGLTSHGADDLLATEGSSDCGFPRGTFTSRWLGRPLERGSVQPAAHGLGWRGSPVAPATGGFSK